MRKLIGYAALLAFAIVTFGSAGPAQAQATRTWVSGVGDDANPCSRTAPCKTFAGAISKTAAGGEISVLDPGGYGAVTITKSISIINDYSGEAGILASGSNGVTVNAGVNDIIILRGLVIDGAPPASPGQNGIRFIAGSALHIEKCLIKNFVATATGNGILFAPASGAAELFVSNTTLINNGTPAAASGNGILIQPTGSGSAKVSLNRVQMENNRVGLRADSTTTSGTVTVSVYDSTVVGNTNNGVVAAANGQAATIIISNSVVSHNATNGLLSSGTNATVRVGGSLITGNSVAVLAQSGGVLTSYKQNIVDGNTTNNTPITASSLN